MKKWSIGIKIKNMITNLYPYSLELGVPRARCPGMEKFVTKR